MNEFVIGILIVLVGALVVATAYLVLKLFLDNESKKRLWEYRNNNIKITTPLRLQAYERMILFLERISPNSLIPRLQTSSMTAKQLQIEMLSLIRAEFEHNLAQQLYMSTQAWDVIISAKENIIKLINISADEISPEKPSIELSQKIMTHWILINPTPIRTAIDFLKKEAQQIFI